MSIFFKTLDHWYLQEILYCCIVTFVNGGTFMKATKFLFVLLAVSCMIPAFARCGKGGCCRRGRCGKVTVAAKKVVKRACTACNRGYCKLK